MTSDDVVPSKTPSVGFEPDDLDNHTVEELSDYLDAGRTPSNPSIDASPGCQLALQSMTRLRELSRTLLEAESSAASPLSESWVGKVLGNITMDARAGRQIPLRPPTPETELVITEGAVRGIVRATESRVDGIVVGRCRLDGDVTTLGEPITVRVDASAIWGQPIPGMAGSLREAIYAQLHKHTRLTIAGIDITIRDLLHLPEVEGDIR